MTNSPTILVLASTSRYRKQLLERLGLPFRTCKPEVDETHLPGESPETLVLRLAQAKALAGSKQYPEDALIIGSDQVAVLNNDILGKPGTRERAIEQLSAFSGKSVQFLTGLSVYNTSTGKAHTEIVPYEVAFRNNSRQRIENYVDREKPLDCAGSFKSEGLGIALFERFHGTDPNALIGLPLIRLSQILEEQGMDCLGFGA